MTAVTPPEAITCPECGHPARSPAHYIDVGRRHGEAEGAAAERERARTEMWGAARDRITETNAARRDERKRIRQQIRDIAAEYRDMAIEARNPGDADGNLLIGKAIDKVADLLKDDG